MGVYLQAQNSERMHRLQSNALEAAVLKMQSVLLVDPESRFHVVTLGTSQIYRTQTSFHFICYMLPSPVEAQRGL